MKYLGIDFGLRRIGLATSDGQLASPWKIIPVSGVHDTVLKITGVVKEGVFDTVVVGMPEGKMAKNVAGFIKILKSQGMTVETADETLSSQHALRSMIEQDIPRKRRRLNDAYAAAIILQNYLDER